jgi:hypothetical protein
MNQAIFVLFSLPIVSIVFIAGFQFWDEMFGNKPLVSAKPSLEPIRVFVNELSDILWQPRQNTAE